MLTEEHVTAAGTRIIAQFGVPPPKTAWSDLLRHYLRHIKSPTAEQFLAEERDIHESGHLAFPLALLLGLGIYGGGGRNWISGAIAIAVVIGVVSLLAYHGTKALQRWNEHVTLAFLAISPIAPVVNQSAAPLNAEIAVSEVNKVPDSTPPRL